MQSASPYRKTAAIKCVPTVRHASRPSRPGFFPALFLLIAALAVPSSACAQQPAETSPQAAAPAPSAPQAPQQPDQSREADQGVAPPPSNFFKITGEVTEDGLLRQLKGKDLFLRGGYLGDSISFNEHGMPTGNPAKGPYTLNSIEIDKVRLTKHKVELEGARYGIHFSGDSLYIDPTKDADRIRVTPKKKTLKITIDREQIVKPKEKKVKESKGKKAPAANPSAPASAAQNPSASSAPSPAPPASAPITSSEATAATTQPQESAHSQGAAATDETFKSDQDDKAESSDKAEAAADPLSVTTTTSPAHAAMLLSNALNRIFALGIDDHFRAQLPPFWQLYFQALATGVEYRPKNPDVVRGSAVDQQAKVLTSIAPDSNNFAQTSGIAGRALYRAVIGTDGKASEIAVVRPIGFGLDENAVEAIRKASFQPAMKGGQPVAEALDLAVTFRIYSKRTAESATSNPQANATSKAPILPGPFSEKPQPQAQPSPQPEPQPQPETAPQSPAQSAAPPPQSAPQR